MALAFVLLSATASAAEIPVYDATQVAFNQYVIVKRIWSSSWRSAFWIGGEADIDQAKRSVIEQAERAGAEAVVNLICMSRTDRLYWQAGYYCYADAVKARTPQER